MRLFEIVGLLFKVLSRLKFEYPVNVKFLEGRMVFHGQKEAVFAENFNQRKLKLYCRVATIGLANLEYLTNRKATDFQKKSMVIGCAIAPLIDELMDEKGYSNHEIVEILGKNNTKKSLEAEVCIGLLNDLEHFSPGLAQSEIWAKAIEYQINSNQTSVQKLEQSNLINLCFGKGGYGLLLAILASFPELIATENGRRAFYNVGSIVQFVDDLFDVWNDREEGQQTLVTNCGDMDEISKLFEALLVETNLLLHQLPFEKKRISTFAFALKCYSSLGKVALNQLTNLQKKKDGIFNPAHFVRKELVTDMAVLSNQVRFVKFVLFN